MEEDILPYVAIGLVVYFFIMYLVVSAAVKAGNQSVNYNTKMLSRLVIKYLKSKGMTRKELVDLHNQSTDEFWSSIEEDDLIQKQ
jgi:hypothetical protein